MSGVSTASAQQGLYLDGSWRTADTYREVNDRWSGATLGYVAVGDEGDATTAVDAAVHALESPLPPFRRGQMLREVSRALEHDAERFAWLITAETGKPITAARSEVARAVETIRLCAEESTRIAGEGIPLDDTPAGEGVTAFTIAQARGVVAAITPFNFPLNLLAHKVGPAIAAGCPVVIKPSDHAPLTAGALVDLFHQAGLAAGWIGLVTGDAQRIARTWSDDDRVAVLTFTGSSQVGWLLKAASPRKHHVLELGSNTALYIAPTADVDAAVAAAIAAGYGNSGQACVSLQRLIVHASIADCFIELFTNAVGGLIAGDPRDEATAVGPVITTGADNRLSGLLDDAARLGATVHRAPASDGVFAPAVVLGAPSTARIMSEEAFGPVVTVSIVDSLEDAITLVNAVDFGLNAAIHTNDLSEALAFSKGAEAGSVLVNLPPSFRTDAMPYGGVKGSGQGREGVRFAIREMTHEKLVAVRSAR